MSVNEYTDIRPESLVRCFSRSALCVVIYLVRLFLLSHAIANIFHLEVFCSSNIGARDFCLFTWSQILTDAFEGPLTRRAIKYDTGTTLKLTYCTKTIEGFHYCKL